MSEALGPQSHGLNFFTTEVDGEWRGGWFRIRDGILQVYSCGQIRTASVDGADIEALNDVLRDLLLDIVRKANEQ